MLEIRNLTKVYKPKKGVPVIALDNVSLNIEERGLVFILGKSGSGKSTLLNLLGGLDKYDDGDIIIKGKSTKDFAQSNFDSYRNTYVGFIFQEYNILDEFSVGANIALAIELQGRKASNKEVNEILKILDLEGYGARRPNELSGGQKQRVAIARALVKNPDIILADEPTGALDSKTGIQIFDILKELSKDKLVLVVSHDREFAEKYGDRVIELADGKIISDITKKYVASSYEEVANLQYVKNEGLIVKEGYKLSAHDLDMINAYLEKEKQINLISKPLETFDKEQVFVETTNKLDLRSYEEELVMIKSKLPNKMAFRMGASGLNHKKVRLVFTILLSLVAFTLFGVTDTLASYNKITATVDSIIDENIKAAVFSKKAESYNKGGGYFDLLISDEDVSLLNEKLYFGNEFKPVFNGGTDSAAFSITRNLNGFEREYHNDRYYFSFLSGLVEYTKDELLELDFQIYGQMPSADDEIAITKYTFEHFAKYGYKNDVKKIDRPAGDIKSYEDMIGETISIDGYNSTLVFTITAVIDTMIDENRYEKLKNPSSNTYDYFLNSQFDRVIKYGFHSLGYVNNGYIQKKIEENRFSGVDLSNVAYYNLFSQINENYTIDINIEHVDSLTNFNIDEITFFNKDKTSLSENEIITSLETYLRFAPENQIVISDFNLPTDKFFEVYYDIKGDGLYKYAEENYHIAEENGLYKDLNIEDADEITKIVYLHQHLNLDERHKDELMEPGFFHSKYVDKSGCDIIKEGLKLRSEEVLSNKGEFTGTYLDLFYKFRENALFEYAFRNYELAESNNFFDDQLDIIDSIFTLMAYFETDEGFHNKSYFSKTGHELINEAQETFKDYIIKDKNLEVEVNQELNKYYLQQNSNEFTKVKIVGFYKDYQPNSFQSIILNNNLYEELKRFGEVHPYGFVLAIMPSSRADIRSIVEFNYKDNDGILFPLQNSITPTIEMANDMVEQVSNVFFYIGIGFAVFAGLMLSNFIGTSVTRKKREIGILRALGARSTDVFKIFFNESFIIALINFIFSTAATVIVVMILNDTLRHRGGIVITLFSFSVRQVVLLFAISMFVALVASYLPVRKIARKKPVDAISNK